MPAHSFFEVFNHPPAAVLFALPHQTPPTPLLSLPCLVKSASSLPLNLRTNSRVSGWAMSLPCYFAPKHEKKRGKKETKRSKGASWCFNRLDAESDTGPERCRTSSFELETNNMAAEKMLKKFFFTDFLCVFLIFFSIIIYLAVLPGFTLNTKVKKWRRLFCTCCIRAQETCSFLWFHKWINRWRGQLVQFSSCASSADLELKHQSHAC